MQVVKPNKEFLANLMRLKTKTEMLSVRLIDHKTGKMTRVKFIYR